MSNQKHCDMCLDAIIETFREYQKEWLTSHNDIEFTPEDEDLLLQFLDDTAEMFIKEYTE